MQVVYDNATGEPALIGRDENGKACIVTDGDGGEVIELDAYRPHATGWAVCRECGDFWVVVVDVRVDFRCLECRKGCGMTAELQADKPADVIRLPTT